MRQPFDKTDVEEIGQEFREIVYSGFTPMKKSQADQFYKRIKKVPEEVVERYERRFKPSLIESAAIRRRSIELFCERERKK